MGEPSCIWSSARIEPEPSFSQCLSVAFTSFVDSGQPSHRDEALESQGQRALGWPGPSRGSCQRGRRCLQAVFAAAAFSLAATSRTASTILAASPVGLGADPAAAQPPLRPSPLHEHRAESGCLSPPRRPGSQGSSTEAQRKHEGPTRCPVTGTVTTAPKQPSGRTNPAVKRTPRHRGAQGLVPLCHTSSTNGPPGCSLSRAHPGAAGAAVPRGSHWEQIPTPWRGAQPARDEQRTDSAPGGGFKNRHEKSHVRLRHGRGPPKRLLQVSPCVSSRFAFFF